MDGELNDLLERLRRLEEEFEQKIEAQRAAFRYRLQKDRVVFEQSVIAEHRHIKIGLMRFLRGSNVGCLLLSPFIYFLIFPLLLLDFSVWLFQVVCFSVWGIERVRRSGYILLDRRHLAYVTFQFAVPRNLFRETSQRNDNPRLRPASVWVEEIHGMV